MAKDTIQERWNEGYYTQLNGAKILGFIGTINDGDGGDGFPRFMVKLASGENIFIEISQDPEGNGGGFIFGLPDYTLPEFRTDLTVAK
jgi:hypothetical protein